MTRHSRALLGALALALGPGCAELPEPESRPSLRIATDATFPPFHYLDEAGQATGFEIELARLAAERAGLEPEVAVVPYEELLAGLERGRHDLVAATTGITEERERRYLFTAPYFRTCQAALVRAGAGGPETLADLEGLRVAAAGAGTSARALERLNGVERVVLGKGQEGVPALLEGATDALVVDEYDAVEAARAAEGRLRVIAEPVALESYAFVLASGQEELRDRLDAALTALAHEGVLEALKARFGVLRDEAWPVRLDR